MISKSFFDLLKEDLNDNIKVPPPPPMEGSLTLIRMSKCDQWCLIKQPVSREEKWVDKSEVFKNGAMIAFYDADPTFLPGSERSS